MGAQGTAILDFGAFPGSSITFIDTAATGVISTSAVEAWIRPVASTDHTVEDHIVAPMRVVGQYLSDDNIRIYGVSTLDIVPPLELAPRSQQTAEAGRPHTLMQRQNTPMFVGTFNVWWVWN